MGCHVLMSDWIGVYAEQLNGENRQTVDVVRLDR